jgi:hypothetical protein
MVEIATEKQKRYKSLGNDQIPSEMIQEGGKTLHSEIHKLITCIWNEEEMPQQWSDSMTVLIYIKCDESDCSNYRGISLLLTAFKMLPNILASRLPPNADKITGDHQRGFRCNRSTTGQIFWICQILEKIWEYNVIVHQLLKDFEKVYDSVRRKVLCNILNEFCIPMKLVRLI